MVLFFTINIELLILLNPFFCCRCFLVCLFYFLTVERKNKFGILQSSVFLVDNDDGCMFSFFFFFIVFHENVGNINYSRLFFVPQIPHVLANCTLTVSNYWTWLSIKAEVCVICRSQRLRRITQ